MIEIRRLLLSIFVICLSAYCAQSQSIAGFYGNYAGSYGALLNPASLTTSNVYADFGLNVNVLAYNDYFHLKSIDALKAINDKSYNISYQKIVSGLPRLFDFDFKYGSEKPASANANVDVVLLSGMYNFKNKFAVAFSVRARSNVNLINMPSSMLEIGAVGLNHHYDATAGSPGADTTVYYNQYARTYLNKNADIGVMAWSEFAVSYARNIYNQGYEQLDFGVNAKVALATGAAAISLKQLDYHLKLDENEIVNDSLWFMDNVNGSMAYSLPVGYDTPFKMKGDLSSGKNLNGYGLDFDIGLTYTVSRTSRMNQNVMYNCQMKPIDYQYRIGVSVLDLGAVYFGGGNAEVMKVNATNSVINTKKFENINTVHEFVSTLGDSLETKIEKNGFWMGLPTAVSLQFDYSFNRHWFVNVVAIQPVNMFRYHVTRDAQLLLSPRYESVLFDFALPVTLLDYSRVLLGASARFAFLTVGTQNLMNLLGCGEAYGLDIYVALKINFNRGRCHSNYGACWNNDFGSRPSRRR